MKRIALFAVTVFAMSASAWAQAPAEALDKALLASPANLKEGATVVVFKPDYTYETVKKGTNRLVCFDRSGLPGQQPFSVECTSIANLDRVAQNLKFEAETDRAKRQAALDAAEKDGSRVKPEYGSVWYRLQGPDKDKARMHMTVAVPGATTQSTGLPDNGKVGGVWIMNAGTTTAHLMIPGH
jgi:hypothetical protein